MARKLANEYKKKVEAHESGSPSRTTSSSGVTHAAAPLPENASVEEMMEAVNIRPAKPPIYHEPVPSVDALIATPLPESHKAAAAVVAPTTHATAAASEENGDTNTDAVAQPQDQAAAQPAQEDYSDLL